MPFPLPLVPFEQYMLAENTPDYPRAFVIDLRLSGLLNRAALESAWQTALSRHPLLRALLENTWTGWQWVAAPDGPRAIDWGDIDAPLEFASGEIIDLTREPGVRLWARVGGGRSRLVVQMHHAAADGVGGLQFAGDLLAEYARATDPGIPTLPPLDPGLLRDRGTFGLTRPSFREWLGHVATTIRESIRLLARRVIPVRLPTNGANEAATPIKFPDIESHEFDAAESQALRQTAEQAGATLNDLLMCSLLQAINDWNRDETHPDRGWLRINVPTNLRRREDLAMPVANVMSFTFLDRRPHDCHDTPRLLESIREEMLAIKRGRLGLYFIAQLALLAKVPGGMSLALNRRGCFATALLTNLGDISKNFSPLLPRREGKLVVGNLVLESMIGTPPLRKLTRVGVAATVYAGQLTLSLLCDRHAFTREQSRRFLEVLLRRVRENSPA